MRSWRMPSLIHHAESSLIAPAALVTLHGWLRELVDLVIRARNVGSCRWRYDLSAM
jgi:hypothetical protein